MSDSSITRVTGTAIPLLLDDIDTDRIIPARYLRCVTFDGLGEHAFRDDRESRDDHPFDHPHHAEAEVLIAGRNFGCGSSREHAPQSLMHWGIDVIVAESFAEIFFGNCTSLGIPCVTAARADLKKLEEIAKASPKTEFTVDLETLTVKAGDIEVPCHMPDGPRKALMTGQYDALGQLLETAEDIEETARSLPYMSNFAQPTA